jgi:SAM-dependent methyltransferase
MTAPQTPDLKIIKGRQQKAWSSGDYGKVGVTLSMMAELLAEAADLTPGQSVLDVASGNGNASLAAARRFCEVSAIDYVPMLLEEGRKRAEAEGLSVHFREGDAENLPFGDASFDAVLSTLGVMFAPDQEKAAGELLRVVRPGGTIGMANWVPDGYVGDLFRTIGRHVPPPAGLKPPFRWGTEEGLDELLGEGIGSLQTRRRTFIWRFPSARHHVDFMRGYYGPLNKAFGALDEAGQNALEGDLISLAVGGQARPRLDHLHRQLHRGPRRRHPRRRRVRHRLHRDRGGWPTGARMHAQQGNKIVGNYIGADKTGTADLGNGDDGVNISAAPNNTVGDTTVGARNVISRNEHGVVIYGAGATGNRVMQNVISRNDETGVPSPTTVPRATAYFPTPSSPTVCSA